MEADPGRPCPLLTHLMHKPDQGKDLGIKEPQRMHARVYCGVQLRPLGSEENRRRKATIKHMHKMQFLREDSPLQQLKKDF